MIRNLFNNRIKLQFSIKISLIYCDCEGKLSLFPSDAYDIFAIKQIKEKQDYKHARRYKNFFFP